MADRQSVKHQEGTGLYTASGRAVAIVALVLALCTLVKAFLCGRVSDGCPCQGGDSTCACSKLEESGATVEGETAVEKSLDIEVE